MNELSINIVHPMDGRVISVTLDSSMTPNEIIRELISHEFIGTEIYSLGIKGGHILDLYKSIYQSGVKDNDTLRIIPSVCAG
ncbi:MAG: hypothetical protein GQ564_10270 [Bacteroidales bacterium]|nr:hypothetical protein [Bacteroidales bacterium]